MDTNRRKSIDRRRVNFRLLPDRVERRKIPDRRGDGLDVNDLSVGKDTFVELFSDFLSKK